MTVLHYPIRRKGSKPDFPRRLPPQRRPEAPSRRVMPCGCTDPFADRVHGPHLRLFTWSGPTGENTRSGGWRCSSCGARKPGSLEAELALPLITPRRETP